MWSLLVCYISSKDYVQTFKKLTFYHEFNKGSYSKQGPNMKELLLHCTRSQFNDSKQIANAIHNYAPKFSFTTKIPHLGSEKIFGSCKWKANFHLDWEGDSHRHDWVFNYWRCWGPQSYMWGWCMAYKMMSAYLAYISMFSITKIHFVILHFKNNFQEDYNWWSCLSLFWYVVSILRCTSQAPQVLVLCRWHESLHGGYQT